MKIDTKDLKTNGSDTNKIVTPDPKRSIRGNRRVSLSGSQFLGIQPNARKASGILARLKNGNPTQLIMYPNLKKMC